MALFGQVIIVETHLQYKRIFLNINFLSSRHGENFLFCSVYLLKIANFQLLDQLGSFYSLFEFIELLEILLFLNFVDL